jgi:hypothetical protein
MMNHPLICGSIVPTSVPSGSEDAEFLKQFNLHTEAHLQPDQKREVEQLLLRWKSIFASSDLDLGHTTTEVHRINLHESTPVRERYRRIPPAMFAEVKKTLENMLQAGVIRESTSPWAAPMVLVRKKDGSIRICVDYRSINSKTIKDAYSLPRIEDVFDSLAGATLFSSLATGSC